MLNMSCMVNQKPFKSLAYSMNYRQNRELYKSLNNEQTIRTNLDFGNSPENLKADYLDVYEGIYVGVIALIDLIRTLT